MLAAKRARIFLSMDLIALVFLPIYPNDSFADQRACRLVKFQVIFARLINSLCLKRLS